MHDDLTQAINGVLNIALTSPNSFDQPAVFMTYPWEKRSLYATDITVHPCCFAQEKALFRAIFSK